MAKNFATGQTTYVGIMLVAAAAMSACGGASSLVDTPQSGAAAVPAGWTHVAAEGQSFSLGASQSVRYGSGTQWVEKTVSGAAQCTNDFFGSDPAVGVTKVCDTRGTSPPPAAGNPPPPVAGEPPAPAVGTATLSWSAPHTNADGSPLSDLAGFRVYYGTAHGKYSKSITVNSPSALRYTIENLPAGNTYYMTVTAFDTSGNESAASTEVSKSIQ